MSKLKGFAYLYNKIITLNKQTMNKDWQSVALEYRDQRDEFKDALNQSLKAKIKEVWCIVDGNGKLHSVWKPEDLERARFHLNWMNEARALTKAYELVNMPFE
jgi:hypothetical protein